MRLQLPTHSYAALSSVSGSARLVNVYAEQKPADDKGAVRLKRSPGIADFATVGNGPGRGVHVMAGTLYAVSGSTLYSVSSSGTATSLGTIAGTAQCWMADNGSQLVIGTDGGTWYVYDGTLAEMSDTDFTVRGARACDFVDNYIVFVEPDSGTWFCSDLADASSVLPLDYADSEGNPDNLVTVAVDHREVVLFGERSIELWYNTAAAGSGFPFERSPGGFMEIGCAANKGVCKLDNSLFWLADDLTIRRLSGKTPQRVSQHGVEERIRSYARVDDCVAFSFTWNGHLCAAFRFPSAGACWVLDVTTGEWHERETYGEDGWLISDLAECYDKVIVQSSETGELGYFSDTTYTEFGDPQRCEWTYQPIYADHKRLFMSSLEIVCETGVGLVTGQGSDPQMTLEMSNDSGRIWHTLPTKGIGPMGEYRTRVKWHRLGMARDRVFRASVSDPVTLTIVDTQIEAQAGD